MSKLFSMFLTPLLSLVTKYRISTILIHSHFHTSRYNNHYMWFRTFCHSLSLSFVTKCHNFSCDIIYKLPLKVTISWAHIRKLYLQTGWKSVIHCHNKNIQPLLFHLSTVKLQLSEIQLSESLIIGIAFRTSEK